MESLAAVETVAENNTPTDRSKPHLRLHAVNVFVRDQERAVRFYVDQLGFRLAFDAHLQSGARWVVVAPPDGATVVRLITPVPASESSHLIGRNTQIAFITDDVIAKFREWSKRGVRFRHPPKLRRLKYEEPDAIWHAEAPRPAAPAEPSAWGGVFTHFEDEDGNTFGLVELDPVSREIDAQRRAELEKLEAERRVTQELQIAKEVQARLFPQSFPSFRTLDYAGACIQARQVGGDYYDFLSLGRERLGLVIGDIAGKGMAAALLMANLQANLRSQCAIALDEPQRFLGSVNRLFYENTDESSYATLFFAEYDDRTRRLRFANCGHLPGLVLRDGNVIEPLHSTCTVMGLFKDWACSFTDSQLNPGETLVLYTDGVTEAFNEFGEEFGDVRLKNTLQRNRELSPKLLVSAILDEVKRFSSRDQHDDITVIAARSMAD